jgi:GTP-sensing pleiotropic transcriptional regulator CodY
LEIIQEKLFLCGLSVKLRTPLERIKQDSFLKHQVPTEKASETVKVVKANATVRVSPKMLPQPTAIRDYPSRTRVEFLN